MDKRRTAADALQMSPDVASFISAGVPSQPESTAPKRLDKPSKAELAETNTKASDSASGSARPKAKRKETLVKHAQRNVEKPAEPTPAYTQAMAQARIQKSVRFLPQLIARFEDHCLKELQAGRKPPTLQHALNAAFRDWLA